MGSRSTGGCLGGALNPKVLSRLISVEGLPDPPVGHYAQTRPVSPPLHPRRPGPFLRAPGCESAPNIWAGPREGDPSKRTSGEAAHLS